MCICRFVYMKHVCVCGECVYMWRKCVYEHRWCRFVYVNMCIYMGMCIHEQTHTHAHTHKYTHLHTHTHAHTQTHTFSLSHTHTTGMCTLIHVYMHVYTCISLPTHLYIQVLHRCIFARTTVTGENVIVHVFMYVGACICARGEWVWMCYIHIYAYSLLWENATDACIYMHVYTCGEDWVRRCMYTYWWGMGMNVLHTHMCIFTLMGWLRLVGSLKLQVFFVEYCLFYRSLLQKRPIIWRSLLIVTTPYQWYTSDICMYI